MHNVRIVFFYALLLISAFDLLSAYGQALAQFQDHTSIPLHSLGNQFMGLETVFKGVPKVGYFTDKDLTNTLAVAQYEQAQYMLAPTVLDINHTQWHWVIFDCTSPQIAMESIKHLGFIPLKMNHGIVLAINPNGI